MNSDLHLDLEALSTLKEIMEDDFGLLIDTFINDSSERLATLAQEIERGDSDAVRRSAHSFKGSSSNIGALRLAELCLIIESQGNEGNLVGLEDHLKVVNQEFELVKQALADL